jgi:5-methyltetrahydropteroyltriglutamate--homocysteine methyltransferase
MNLLKTSVIGSYPIKINNIKFIINYFNGIESSWNEYILTAVNDMIKTGIDLISDGQTRDPFINIFTRNIKGIRIRNRPEIISKIEYFKPIILNDIIKIKKILPKDKQLIGVIAGPYTLSETVANFYYKNKIDLAFDFAHIIKKEINLIEKHVDLISIDEPFFSNNFPEIGFELIKIITNNINCPTRLHVCGDVSKIIPNLIELPVDILSHEFKAKPNLIKSFKEYENKKKICLGSVRSDNNKIESTDEILSHIDLAYSVFGDKIIQISPDCGQKLLSRNIAFNKLKNLVKAGEIFNGR